MPYTGNADPTPVNNISKYKTENKIFLELYV
jgi:hypothetical protein